MKYNYFVERLNSNGQWVQETYPSTFGATLRHLAFERARSNNIHYRMACEVV